VGWRSKVVVVFKTNQGMEHELRLSRSKKKTRLNYTEGASLHWEKRGEKRKKDARR
jgi:hypothetical protein